jgi:hypothetical protein
MKKVDLLNKSSRLVSYSLNGATTFSIKDGMTKVPLCDFLVMLNVMAPIDVAEFVKLTILVKLVILYMSDLAVH